MSERRRTRRNVLAGCAVAAIGSLAGCTDVLGDGSTATPEPLTALSGQRVYVDESLSRSVPDAAERVDDPDDADVVVLPADTDHEPSPIVNWLEGGTYVAFLGRDSEAAWHAVQDSDAYETRIGRPQSRAESCSSSGSGSSSESTDCEPPDLVVAWLHEAGMGTTYRKTWGHTDDPTDRELFAAIDRALRPEQ